MKANKWVIGFLTSFMLLAIFFACERNITNIEDVSESGVIPADNCFYCHSDEDTRIVGAAGEWANSKHASGENIDRNTSPCSRCHTSEGFVEFAATGSMPALVQNPTAIHCFTCHAPHTNGNFTLRITAEQELQNGESFDLGKANICVACHQSRQNINTYITPTERLSERWGPHHSNQADMLIGTNGYEYDDYDYGNTNHAAGTLNGCLDCHYEVRNSYFLGGHSFNMTHGEGSEVSHNTEACAVCHGDMDDAEDFDRSYIGGDGIQEQVRTLTQTLFDTLVAAGLVEYYPEDDSWLPADGRTTTADSAGAVWNWLVVEEDRSHGVHNPRYALDLLKSALEFLEVSPAASAADAGVDWRSKMYSSK